MADNTTLSAGAGGNTIRTLEDGSGVHWPVGVICWATSTGTPDVLAIPLAAALADNATNPTTILLGSCLMGYDGATWDRIYAVADGDAIAAATKGLMVLGHDGANYQTLATNSSGQVVVVGTGTFVVQAAQSGAWSVTANAGTNLNTSALALEAGGNLAGAATSLAILDDWDESDRAKVNPIVGQAGVQGGSGGVSALTQRVVLATDVALPAGTNAIGKLSANSGVDIGDVDVTSIAAGDNNIGNVDIVTVPADPFGVNADAASATGSISAKLRFIASTGIPITGTVTVGSHAVTNAGTFAVQPGAATSGGTSQYSILSTTTAIAATVKATPGQVYGVHVYNRGTNEVFLRLYDNTTTPATTDNAAIVYRGIVPGNTAGAGVVFNLTPGMAFANGIGLRVTAGVSDTDGTILAAEEVTANVMYK